MEENANIEQSSMFDYIKDPEVPQYLNVLKNGCDPVQLDYDNLFSDNYDTLQCVTFSSSVSFFNEICSKYRKATVIIGLPNDDFKKSQMLLMRHYKSIEGEKILAAVTPESRDKILNNEISILYPENGLGTIHSKLYLLKNSSNGETRVIIGSANLSKQAFSTKIHQFEEVQFYDNDEKRYQVFENRFNHIKKYTSSFFPEITLRNSTKEKVYVMVKEEKDEYLAANIAKILKESDQIFELQKTLDETEAEETFDDEAIKYMGVVVKSATNGKDENVHVKSHQQIVKAIHRTESVYSTSDVENETNRPLLIKKPGIHDFDFVLKPGMDTYSNQFKLKADNAEISEQMDLICRWMQSYENSVNITAEQLLDKQKHAFEYLLYCFSSPFLKEIRDNITDNNNGVDNVAQTIPMFAALAGVTSSGKTMHMQFVNKLMSGSNTIYDFTKYKFTAKKIINQCTTDNRYPFFIDEAKTVVFDGKSWVEKLKSVANNMETKNACIFTTNWDKFIIKPDLKKRMYVIKLKYPFPEKKQNESGELCSEASTILYQDFVYRMFEFMNANDKYYSVDASNTLDFLYIARMIFKEYFSICSMDIPNWFPDTIIDDLSELPRERWQSLYRFQIDKFTYNSSKDTISFPRDIAVNSKGDAKEIQSLMDYNIDLIPDRYMIGQRNSPFIEVRAGKKTHDGFYDFIGLDEKGREIGKKDSLWSKLFG